MSQAAVLMRSSGGLPLVKADGHTNRIWLDAYAPGVPHEIDFQGHASLNDYMDEFARKYRDREAFVSLRTSITYAEVAQSVLAFAAWLQSQGVKKGDRVALMLPNCFQYPICLFAILKVGAVVVNVNPLYTVRELHHQLQDSGAQTIVVMENFAKTVQDAMGGTAIERVVLTQLGDLLSRGALNFKGRAINFGIRRVFKMVPDYCLANAVWMRAALKAGSQLPVRAVPMQLDDLAFLQYTGGTTGVAKGAMLTHGNIIANALQAQAMATGQLTQEVETIVTLIPLYHIFSLTVNCLIFMGLGGRNILVANPRNAKTVMYALKGEKLSGISGVNTMFAALLDNPDFRKLDFSRLKLAMAGGMALHRSIAERWLKLTGVPLVEGYGLTECSPVVSAPPVDIRQKPLPSFSGTIGVPMPSTEVRIRKEDGGWADTGEVGELCVRGPQVMKGYWQRPEETAQTIDPQGWLMTGDVAVMDDRGFLKIVDRKKDMILVSGFNVYPNEIEDVLALHPGVREAAAVGVPDPVAGERVKVFVVRADPGLTEAALIEHCRKHLTGYKIPRIVEFSQVELPKTPVGKILRRQLRDGSP